MLKLAEVTKADVVYDLGCGDGRIVITAAKDYGAKGVGVDINPDRIQEARTNAKKRRSTTASASKRTTCSRRTSGPLRLSPCTCFPTST